MRVHEKHVKEEAVAELSPCNFDFKIHGYINDITGEHHLALVKGEIGDGEDVLCRVHSECLTGDAFGSLRCDCGLQLQTAMRQVEAEGRGIKGKTLWNAKRELEIDSVKRGKQWYWMLPE